MKKNILRLFSSSLLMKGSLIVLLGSVLANFGSYMFHLLMGRWLGPSDYGVLESLVSILTLLSIPLGVLNLVIVKFISQKNNKGVYSSNQADEIFIRLILKKISVFGLIILVLFLAFFPITKNLVRINSFYLISIVGITFYLSIFLSTFSSILQGRLDFKKYCFLNIFGTWSKLFFGVILVLIGFKVGGAITAFALSAFFSALVGYLFLKKNISFRSFNETKKKLTINFLFHDISSYSLAVLLSSLSLASLISADIILARYFLSPLEAGYYAALSVLGKIIFFASNPVISVMFPMISEKHSEGKDHRLLLFGSFAMVLIISLLITFAFSLFPTTMIAILFGTKYLVTANNLRNFAIFISLYSLCSLLINYYLSISKKIIVVLPVIFSILQVFFINLFHKDIYQIVTVNIVMLSIFLLVLLIFLLRDMNIRNTVSGSIKFLKNKNI